MYLLRGLDLEFGQVLFQFHDEAIDAASSAARTTGSERIAPQAPIPVTAEQEEFAVLGNIADRNRSETRSVLCVGVARPGSVVMSKPPRFGGT